MAKAQPEARTGNQLLDHLPAGELDKLLPHARRVTFRARQDLSRPNDPASPVYFPIDSVFSLLLPMQDGRQLEVGIVDHEGLLGIPAVLGLPFNPLRATTQIPGDCLRFAPDRFAESLRDCPTLDGLVRRYIAYGWRSACQNAACNLLHTVEQRMSRWLLMVQDRTRTAEFPLTQEFLSEMLGVSRQTVTVTAGALQAAGLIDYGRGRVRVVDRAGLEATCCECYQALRDAYLQIMGFRLTAPAARAGGR